MLVTAFAAAVAVRYRHYGVYETHEDDQLVDEEDLRNPVVVLDRNQESYINLKYPVLVNRPEGVHTVWFIRDSVKIGLEMSQKNSQILYGLSLNFC